MKQSHFARGNQLFREQRYEEAVEAYRKAIEQNPSFYWYYLNFGKALLKVGKNEEAVHAFSQVKILNPYLDNTLLEMEAHASDLTLQNENSEQVKSTEEIEAAASEKQKIVLFTPYYKSDSPERQDELIYCLQKNIQCDEVEKIILIIDDNHIPELESPKLEIVRVTSRPTYLDWIELTEKKCLSSNSVSVLANTDMYFDDSISQLREIFSINPMAFVALSRYDRKGLNTILHPNPQWSQDVWAISSQFSFSDSFRRRLSIPLGIPRCDNKISYLFHIHGIKIYNPCHHVISVHVHETQLRNYDKKGDTRILGGTAYVYPNSIISEPSKVEVELWTLNSEKIKNVKVNNTLLRWKESRQQEQTKVTQIELSQKTDTGNHIKNVIGFDAEWQYPAITEKHAYIMAKKLLPEYDCHDNIVYFGFPWATLIDQLIHNKADQSRADFLTEKLHSFKAELSRYRKVVTVCQHIRMLEVENIFSEVGITDIFWSHTTKNQRVLPAYPEITLHPFPLYPVQAINIDNDKKISNRKYLYSFVGTRATQKYLTDIRNQIIDHLSGDDRGLIIVRDKWHYNKIVYDHQILNRVEDTNALVDELASEEFKQIMKDSIFALCPSGSGPNSIRLWEAIGFGSIPVILSDSYLPPGDLELWDKATVNYHETIEEIKDIPNRLEQIQNDNDLLLAKQNALQEIWLRYGSNYFIYDILDFFALDSSKDLEHSNILPDSKTFNILQSTHKQLGSTKTSYKVTDLNFFFFEGEDLKKNKKFDQAVLLYVKALEQISGDWSTNQKIHQKLEVLLQASFSQSNLSSNSLNTLERLYRSLIPQYPHFQNAYINLGKILALKGEFKESSKIYRDLNYQILSKSKPGFIEAYWPTSRPAQPDFLIIGVHKSGTTSLYDYIIQHPRILPAIRKEIRYLDVHKKIDNLDWYYSHFPPLPDTPKFYTGEATPYYYFKEDLPVTIKNLLPNIKLIFIMRNPIDRAISQYSHWVKSGREKIAIEERFNAEINSLRESLDFISIKNATSSDLKYIRRRILQNGFCYISFGLYILFLENWFSCFPKDQILILKTEDLSTNPEKVMSTIFNFLNVSYSKGEYTKRKTVGSGNTDISADTRKSLLEFFTPYNQLLENKLGIQLDWE